MNREIFVDSSAWIAVSDRRDKYHPVARAEYTSLLNNRSKLITTNLVIAEVYILIRRAVGHTQAMRFLLSLKGSPRLVKIYSDPMLESQAESILARYIDHDFSFTDAVSFAVMQAHDIQAAFTFDHHFLALGFTLLPA